MTEKPGNLRIITADGRMSPPVAGVPAVRYKGQAGLLDVALDPAFRHQSHDLFLLLRSSGTAAAVWRWRAPSWWKMPVARTWIRLKVIFHAGPDMESDRQLGSRIAFGKDGKLYLTLGERGITAGRGAGAGSAQRFRQGGAPESGWQHPEGQSLRRAR